MRALPARTPPAPLTVLTRAAAVLAFVGCADAPTAPPASPLSSLDAALPIVVADAAATAAAASGARPSGAVASARASPAVAPAALTVSPPTALGPLSGPIGPEVSDVNNAGQVAGQSGTASGEAHAVLWTPGAPMRDLGTLGGNSSRALAINDAGQVAGSSSTAEGGVHAFRWDANTGMQDLGTLGGFVDASEALGINAAGKVVGYSWGVDATVHAVLWEPRQPPRDLGNLGSSHSSMATDINDLDQVVGLSTAGDRNNSQHPFLWNATTGMRDLTPGASGFIAFRLAINNAGQIIADGDLPVAPGGVPGGFVVEGDGNTPQPLSPISPVVSSGAVTPLDINDAGQVAGTAFGLDGLTHGFLWQRGAGMVLMPPLVGDIRTTASAVNDRGQVAGVSWPDRPDLSGPPHVVVWTVGVAAQGAPVVDRLTAVELPPGVLTGPGGQDLSGVWLRVRLTDFDNALGPWTWRIDWGDGVVSTPAVPRKGEFAFLRRQPYTANAAHVIMVTATGPGGLTSAVATTLAP